MVHLPEDKFQKQISLNYYYYYYFKFFTEFQMIQITQNSTSTTPQV
jgi:hypothetical protein